MVIQTYSRVKPTRTTPITPVRSSLLWRCTANKECEDCRRKRFSLQRVSTTQAEPLSAPPIVHEVLDSPGQLPDAHARAFMEPRFGHDFDRVSIQTRVPKRIQTKLAIGQPGDQYEQEADRVADVVMQTSEANHAPAASGQDETQDLCMQEMSLADKEALRRQAEAQDEGEVEEEDAEEDEESEEETLQAKRFPGDLPERTVDLERDIHAAKSTGEPLPESARSFFEPRFGHDFSQVRIHASDQAANVAKLLCARAFTMGPDVVFGPGQYVPNTETGRRLIAHELTHVIQQGAGSPLKQNPIPGQQIQRMPVSQVQSPRKVGVELVQLTPEECAYGEIRQHAVVSVKNLATPPGLADAVVSIGAACARNTNPRNCNCVDGSTATAPADQAAWQNINGATGGTDRSGGGNFFCVDTRRCSIVTRCRTTKGKLVRRTRNLTPSGTVNIGDQSGGTVFFFDDPRNGVCPPKPKPKPKPKSKKPSGKKAINVS